MQRIPRAYPLLPGFRFDEELAARVVGWWRRHLSFSISDWGGKPFVLLPWQEEAITRLFATVDEAGVRQYRHLFLGIPKKNGKTELSAGVGLRVLCGDRQNRPEVYSAALNEDQASLSWRAAAKMVKQRKALSKRVSLQESVFRMRHVGNDGRFHVLSGETAGKQGLSPSCVIFDEIHEQTDRGLWDALTSRDATMARRSPIIMTTTTAGHDRATIGYEVWERAVAVQRDPELDPTMLAYVWAAPEDADWQDRRVWQACNPSWGEIIRESEVEIEVRQAAGNHEEELRIRQWRLNQWPDLIVAPWLPIGHWDACAGEPAIWRSGSVFAGLDLGPVDGLSVLVVVAAADGLLHVEVRPWVPEESIERAGRGAGGDTRWRQWESDGLLTATPGGATDLEVIRDEILQVHGDFPIASLGVVQWSAAEIEADLEEAGIEVWEVGQTARAQNEAARSLFRRVVADRLRHGGNELLRAGVLAAEVDTDRNNQWRVDRVASHGDVQAVVALLCAVDAVVRHEGEPDRERWGDGPSSKRPPSFNPFGTQRVIGW